MTFISTSEKEIRTSLALSKGKKLHMELEAGGETLDGLAEGAFIDYLLSLKKELHDKGGFEIKLVLRDVFLAGYRASEERNWK